MPVRMTKSPLTESLFDKFRKNLGKVQQSSNSVSWFRTQLETLRGGINRRQLVANAPSGTRLEIGSMYMFFYEAKNDQKLPYWDRFPLVIPIEIYGDGFLGLNLHYLEPTLRAKFLDKLMDFSNTQNVTEKTRFIASYKLLASAARYNAFKPCVKKYLSLQVRSNMLKVEPKDWGVAIFLPVEMFQKVKNREVWKDSSDMVQ